MTRVRPGGVRRTSIPRSRDPGADRLCLTAPVKYGPPAAGACGTRSAQKVVRRCGDRFLHIAVEKRKK